MGDLLKKKKEGALGKGSQARGGIDNDFGLLGLIGPFASLRGKNVGLASDKQKRLQLALRAKDMGQKERNDTLIRGKGAHCGVFRVGRIGNDHAPNRNFFPFHSS